MSDIGCLTHEAVLVLVAHFLLCLLDLGFKFHVRLLQVGHLLEPGRLEHCFIFDFEQQLRDAVVILREFALTLFALLRDAVLALALVSVDRESVVDLTAALEGTLDQTELANFIAVVHQLRQGNVVLAALLGALERGSLVRFLHKWVDRLLFFCLRLASGTSSCVVVFFETSLTNGLLAPLALDWGQRQHLAVRAREHLKYDVLA